jgi:hypothetical protein
MFSALPFFKVIMGAGVTVPAFIGSTNGVMSFHHLFKASPAALLSALNVICYGHIPPGTRGIDSEKKTKQAVFYAHW